MKLENKKSSALILITLGACALLAIYLFNITQIDRSGFLGIADAQELQVVFETPVEIKKIHVISGQTIHKGQLLLELNQDELNSRIESLDIQIKKISAEIEIRHQMTSLFVENKKKQVDIKGPLEIELDGLKNMFEALQNQKKNLYYFSSVDGVVSQVNFKAGSKVEGFNSVLSISKSSPTFITGFVNEKLNINLHENQIVTVRSSTRPEITSTALVKNVGMRTIPIPDRLLRITGIVTYGREVHLQLEEKNPFLIGEKVIIDPSKVRFSFMSSVYAAEVDKNILNINESYKPLKIKLPEAILEKSQFEPSGLLWLEDLKKFLVVSDDTDSKKSPYLFLMNSDGEVDSHIIKMSGLDEMADVESITQDKNNIYLLSSLSKNKNDHVKTNRGLLLKVSRNNLDFSIEDKVEIRSILISFLKNNLNLFDSGINVENDLDVEAMTVVNNNLVLALKSPLTADHKSIFIRINNFATLFTPQLFDPQNIVLEGVVKLDKEMKISDLISDQTKYYFSASCKKKNCSGLYVMEQLNFNSLKNISFFDSHKLEGLSFGSKERRLFGVFDEGSKDPYFFTHEK